MNRCKIVNNFWDVDAIDVIILFLEGDVITVGQMQCGTDSCSLWCPAGGVLPSLTLDLSNVYHVTTVAINSTMNPTASPSLSYKAGIWKLVPGSWSDIDVSYVKPRM